MRGCSKSHSNSNPSLPGCKGPLVKAASKGYHYLSPQLSQEGERVSWGGSVNKSLSNIICSTCINNGCLRPLRPTRTDFFVYSNALIIESGVVIVFLHFILIHFTNLHTLSFYPLCLIVNDLHDWLSASGLWPKEKFGSPKLLPASYVCLHFGATLVLLECSMILWIFCIVH